MYTALRSVAAVALLAAGAACGPETGQITSSITSAAQVQAEPSRWRPCPLTGQPTRQCATVAVPIDWADPDAGTVGLAVSRLPATASRIGVLVLDPGGPGISGFYSQANVLPPELTARFDVVGFDRRGVRQSAAVDCGEPSGAVDRLLEGPQRPEEVERDVRAYVEGCAKKAGPLLGHLGTRDAARDLEAIRVALGEERLSLLVTSYGTVLGQAYLSAYPDRVRVAIFDGAVDTEQRGVAFARGNSLDEQQLAEPGDLKERLRPLLAGFVPWCTGNPYECALAIDPLGRVAAAGDPEITLRAAQAVAFFPERWKPFADAVARGDLTAIAAQPFPKDVADLIGGTTPLALTLGVHCADFAFPSQVAALLTEAGAGADLTVARDYVSCASWPGAGEPLGTLSGERALLVNSVGDVRTPLKGARRVAERFGGLLLTVPGKRHGVLTGGDACAARAAVDYLVEQRAPTELTCP